MSLIQHHPFRSGYSQKAPFTTGQPQATVRLRMGGGHPHEEAPEAVSPEPQANVSHATHAEKKTATEPPSKLAESSSTSDTFKKHLTEAHQQRMTLMEQLGREGLILSGFGVKTVLPFAAAFAPLPLPITLMLTLPLPYVCAPMGNKLIQWGTPKKAEAQHLTQLSRLVLALPHEGGLAELKDHPEKLDHLSDEISKFADGTLDASFIKHLDKKLLTLGSWALKAPGIKTVAEVAEHFEPTRVLKKRLGTLTLKHLDTLSATVKQQPVINLVENLKHKGRVKQALGNLSEQMGKLRLTNLQWGIVTAQASEAMAEGKPLKALYYQVRGGCEMLFWKSVELLGTLLRPVPVLGPILYQALNWAPEVNLAWTSKDMVQGLWHDLTKPHEVALAQRSTAQARL
ncbi:MAG: hypothetical protein ACKO37_09715 [Vampirovibrionales bacterium]